MKFGVNGYFLRDSTRRVLLEWFRRVDAGPFNSLSTGERVLLDHLDPFVYLGSAAAVTERVTLMSNVTVVPLHPPVLLAKRFASLDLLCDGRLIIGAGTGSQQSDYRLAAVSMERRWQRLDEAVATMREIWSGALPYPDAAGPVGPAPVRPGGPPFYTSARAPKSLARAARWADGWQGAILAADPTELRQQVDVHLRAWEDANRETRPYLMNAVTITHDGDADVEGGNHPPMFGISAIPELVDRHARAGYDELVFAPMQDGLHLLDDLQRTLEKLI